MNFSAVSLDTPNLVREILGVTNQRALFPDKLVFRHASCQERNPRLCEDIPELNAKHLRTCQVCNYEGRGRSLKSVSYCYKHCVRTCTMVQPDIKERKVFIMGSHSTVMKHDANMRKWLCTNSDLTCWEKMHQFYLPQNVFLKVTKKGDGLPSLQVNRASTMYKARQFCFAPTESLSSDSEMLESESEGEVSTAGGSSLSVRAPTRHAVAVGRMHRSGIISSPNSNNDVHV